MFAFVIAKDTTPFPKEVAHLYEHWFIASFFSYVERELRVDRGTIGYMGGENFTNMTFIEAWFYDKAAADLFQRFVERETLEKDLLQTCIQQCASESRELWTIQDQPLLHDYFQSLQKTNWQYDTNLAPFEYSDTSHDAKLPITITKAASSYRLITILVNLAHGSLEEKALLMRFYVVLSDIIGRHIQQYGWYELDTLSPRENADGMYFISSVSLPRGAMKNTDIAKDILKCIRTFDVSLNMPYITAHFTQFANEQLWKGRIRGDLHDISIVATNAYIAKLATQENIENLLQKVTLHIETVSYEFAKNISY